MTIHHEDSRVTLHHGDCLDILRAMPDNSVDSIVTDPPYGLEFMGKGWDTFGKDTGNHGHKEKPRWTENAQGTRLPNTFEAGKPFQQWCELWTAECLRVLKPGGHLLAFGGTRTWHRLACAVEDAGFEVRDSIAWLYGSGFPKSLDVSKAIDKAAGAEREVVGPGRWNHVKGTGDQSGALIRPGTQHDITAPATDAAREWAGWGTALKPGHEPVVWGVKPLTAQGILTGIGSHLDTLEQVWRALEAEQTTPTGAAGGSPAQTDTSQSESTAPTSSSTVTSWRACWAELCDLTSTSTTATTSETTTALRTLSSSLSRLTDESTHPSATSPHGSTSLASAVDNLFASVVCGLRATLALSATEPATGSTPASPLDAAGANAAAFEPVVVARKPLIGTVAANVLTHGTGALNVDGCRVDVDEADPLRSATYVGSNPGTAGHTMGDGWANQGESVPMWSGKGRWPANVILDEDMAAVLDEQTPNLSTQSAATRGSTVGQSMAFGTRTPGACYDDETPGASRFFYVAKAPKRERPVVDGVAHPTVKPLALMRWLVRLVTPPGGTVLEPFAGSGTTVEACMLEGFRCIAIEKGEEYLPLIVERIARQGRERLEAEVARQPDAARAIAEQVGQLDIFGEATA